MRFVIALLLVAAATAQHLDFAVLNEGVLQRCLKLATSKNSDRYRRLKSLFEEADCRGDRFREQPVKGSKEPNMICASNQPVESPRTIIVGAHFDCIGGDGIIDNWSGAILLPILAESLNRGPRRHKFELVAFAAEEQGLLGSRTFLKSLSKEDRKQIAAVITMDSLGLTSTKCWPHGSTQELVTAAAAVARALHLEFAGVNVERVGSTDSQTFKDAHIPVLSLHSVTQQTWKIINGPRDLWPAVSWKDYYDSHRFISALLVYLDQTLP